MTDTNVPEFAEQIELALVFRTRQQPSKFVPGIMATVGYIRCPVPTCHAEHDRDLTMARTLQCSCGLFMRATGSGFFIWRDSARQAAE